MMNKKGGLSAILNYATITGVMFLILFLIFGAGGGFNSAFELGKFAAKIPIWVWAILVIVFVFGRRK